MARSSQALNLSQYPHVLPVPQAEPFFGSGNGTDFYLWNSSLPTEGNIVCTLEPEWRNLTAVCCSPQIGIASQHGCRLGDTPENRDFYTNCTHQVALETRSNDTADVKEQVGLECMAFQQALDKERSDTQYRLSQVGRNTQTVVPKTMPICGSVGLPDRFNFTGQCCQGTEGESNGWQGIGGAPINCYWEDDNNNATAKFKDCLAQFQTWSICTNTTTRRSGSDRSRAVAAGVSHFAAVLVAAGAALAAVV